MQAPGTLTDRNNTQHHHPGPLMYRYRRQPHLGGWDSKELFPNLIKGFIDLVFTSPLGNNVGHASLGVSPVPGKKGLTWAANHCGSRDAAVLYPGAFLPS